MIFTHWKVKHKNTSWYLVLLTVCIIYNFTVSRNVSLLPIFFETKIPHYVLFVRVLVNNSPLLSLCLEYRSKLPLPWVETVNCHACIKTVKFQWRHLQKREKKNCMTLKSITVQRKRNHHGERKINNKCRLQQQSIYPNIA